MLGNRKNWPRVNALSGDSERPNKYPASAALLITRSFTPPRGYESTYTSLPVLSSSNFLLCCTSSSTCESVKERRSSPVCPADCMSYPFATIVTKAFSVMPVIPRSFVTTKSVAGTPALFRTLVTCCNVAAVTPTIVNATLDGAMRVSLDS